MRQYIILSGVLVRHSWRAGPAVPQSRRVPVRRRGGHPSLFRCGGCERRWSCGHRGCDHVAVVSVRRHKHASHSPSRQGLRLDERLDLVLGVELVEEERRSRSGNFKALVKYLEHADKHRMYASEPTEEKLSAMRRAVNHKGDQMAADRDCPSVRRRRRNDLRFTR